MHQGRLITFEGGEGAGKSTQLRLLDAALRRMGIDTMATREPGGTPGAEEIRALLVGGDPRRWDAMTEALLHYAARRDHLVAVIRPALECGRYVLSDRFADSTMAYQGYGLGLDRDAIEALYRLVLGETQPDLTLILDLPVEEGLRRAAARGDDDDRYERMDRAFHERLRRGYLDIARREPARCLVIDASGPLEDTHAEILRAVRERLELPG
jgi:dTMP kinase